MRDRSASHHDTIQIWGPSPSNPSELVSRPVSVWLSASDENPDFLLNAILCPRNNLIDPGHWESSRFVNHVLEPRNTMGIRFRRVFAEADQLNDLEHPNPLWTALDVVKRWISDGCPMKNAEGHTYQLFPVQSVDTTKDLEIPFIYGMGSSH
jgi:hypothetical protein